MVIIIIIITERAITAIPASLHGIVYILNPSGSLILRLTKL